MLLSDVSIKRPVFASVLALLLIVFGVLSFLRLPLREFPDIDPPVVSVQTDYPGASANVVETRITEIIEQRIAGIEGIDYIESSSEDGRSSISVSFRVGRDVDAAANDIRDRVAGVLDNLPVEADPPEIQKVDSNDDVILWLNLAGKISPCRNSPITHSVTSWIVFLCLMASPAFRLAALRPTRCASGWTVRPLLPGT